MYRRMFHLAPEGEPVGTGGAVAAPPAAPPAPVVAAPVVATTEPEPHWLPARLERERAAAEKNARAAILKEIGVADPAAAAKLVADEAARVAATKSLEQRALEAETARDAERARAAALSGTVTAIASERMTGLTDQQRAAVTAIAGEDAAAQLRTITALAPTWGAAAPAVTPAAVVPPAATPAVVVPAATTSPARTAPGGSDPAAPIDHKANYESLKQKNPFQAAEYLAVHVTEIYPASKSQ